MHHRPPIGPSINEKQLKVINNNQVMIKKKNQIRMSIWMHYCPVCRLVFLDLSFCEVSSHMHATLQAMSDGPLFCPLVAESKNEAVSNNSVSAWSYVYSLVTVTGLGLMLCIVYSILFISIVAVLVTQCTLEYKRYFFIVYTSSLPVFVASGFLALVSQPWPPWATWAGKEMQMKTHEHIKFFPCFTG